MGLLGEGFHLSGCATFASRVSKGKYLSLGSPSSLSATKNQEGMCNQNSGRTVQPTASQLCNARYSKVPVELLDAGGFASLGTA
jgi:hypothetical protein